MERQEQLENERKERERIKKEKQERLEKERQQQMERERLEKETQERKEREKIQKEKIDQEYKKNRVIEIEKPKVGYGSRFKTYKTDRSFNKLNVLSPTENNTISSNKFRKSIEDKKKPYKQLEEEKEEKEETLIKPVINRKLFRTAVHTPVPQILREEEDKVEHINEEPKSIISIKKKYKKNKISEDEFKSEKANLEELKEDNDKDDSIKNIFIRKKQQIKEEEEQKQTNEEIKPKAYKKSRFRMKLEEEEENEKQSVNNENKKISLFGKQSNKYNKSPSKELITSYDDHNIKKNLQDNGFDFKNGTITVRGKSTRIKIYKCVIWKNTDPNIDENTIRNMIRRSGSQILNNGGFVINLSRHNSLSKNILIGK